MTKTLTVEDLRKSFGSTTALAGVDLEVAAGEVVALIGQNGAGKTTLISIVAALLRPDSGRVRIDGIDPGAQPRRARRRLGLAPQETGLYPVLSARENLRFLGSLAGLGKAELEQRVEEVAAAFALTSLLDRQAQILSGGQRKRLHVAMALMHRPSLLLLDEPTAGVDVEARVQLLATVRGLAAEGSAVLYSTHYLAEVGDLDASVAVLDGGRIVARKRRLEALGDG